MLSDYRSGVRDRRGAICFVLVHTDEGITGMGEATLGGYTKAVVDIIDSFAEFLIGQDPTRIEYLLQVLTRQKFWRGGVIKGSAVAGVELALWDILGKSLDAPVYKLVGGACRDKLRVYVNGWTGGATDPAEVLDKLEAALAAGYENFKFSIAEPSWPVKDTRATIRHRPLPLAMPCAASICFFFRGTGLATRRKGHGQGARQVPMPLAAGERPGIYFRIPRPGGTARPFACAAGCRALQRFSEAWKIASLGDAFSAFPGPALSLIRSDRSVLRPSCAAAEIP